MSEGTQRDTDPLTLTRLTLESEHFVSAGVGRAGKMEIGVTI